jgi:hypothetical protein
VPSQGSVSRRSDQVCIISWLGGSSAADAADDDRGAIEECHLIEGRRPRMEIVISSEATELAWTCVLVQISCAYLFLDKLCRWVNVPSQGVAMECP